MPISASDTYERKRVSVLDSEITYVDTGKGNPVVFLHGNPTSSYLWRNIIPHVEGKARCLAPDLIGMGDSGKNPSGNYRFLDHAKYLDAWFDAILPQGKITLVIHDWGSGLGFYWAHRHPERIAGIVYMEAIVMPVTWDDWPDGASDIFRAMRSEVGEKLVLEKNIFVENILPGSILRKLTPEEHDIYRKPFTEAGESRRPTLTWPREIPLAGEPEDMVAIIDSYGQWLLTAEFPKLFINAEPGAILTGRQREFCRTWANQEEITVKGTHFIQEDSPDEIGEAVSKFIDNV